MKVLKICSGIIFAILPMLLVFGFARVLVGKDTFLPSADELYWSFVNMPNFYDSVVTDIQEIGKQFSELTWDFSNLDGTDAMMNEIWSKVWDLISFFSAVGQTIVIAFQYVGQFFVNIGKFFTCFVPIFVLIKDIVVTPINFINWFLSVMFGYNFVMIG